MSLTILTPSQLADEYLANLKALRPEVNIDQEDSDWWIRSRVVGGVAAGLSSDLNKLSNDMFPQSARREALEQHLITYFGSGFIAASESEGEVMVTGPSGTAVPQGQRFLHESTGNEYYSTEIAYCVDGATGAVPVKSLIAGQSQNLLEGTTLTVVSPPANIGSTATVLDPGLADGRNEETNDQARARLLQRIRNPVRGGTEADYESWCLAADPSVVNVKVLRHEYGLGTVLCVITAGTSDIDAAIDDGDAVVLAPSQETLDEIRDYVDAYNPNTDAVYTAAPVEIPIDVNVTVRFESGDGTTIPGDSPVNQEELVIREIKRAIYKTPIGGRVIGDYGYVMLNELEAMIDLNLGNGNVIQGVKYQIIKDRQIDDLSATGANRMILSSEVAVPGTINVTVL